MGSLLLSAHALLHPCLSMGQQAATAKTSPPKTFRLKIKGISDGGVLLLKPVDPISNFAYELVPESAPHLRVTDQALKEFSTLKDRFPETGDKAEIYIVRNRALAVDILAALSAEDILKKRMKRAEVLGWLNGSDHEEFSRAWEIYKQDFSAAFSRYRQSLTQESRGVAAELYFHPDVIVEGMKVALKDSELLKKIQEGLVKAVETLKTTHIVKVDEEISSFKWAGKVWSTKFEDGQLELTPDFTPQDLKFELQPTSEMDVVRGVQTLAHFALKLPLASVALKIPHLKISGELLKGAKEIKNAAASLLLPKDIPLEVAGRLVLRNDGSNTSNLKQRLNFEVLQFKTPLASAKMGSLTLEGQEFAGEKLDEFLKVIFAPENWATMATELNTMFKDKSSIMNVALNEVMSNLQKRFQGKSVFDKNFVIIDKGGPLNKERFSVQALIWDSALQDPYKNHRIISSFRIQIPLQVSTPPELDLEAVTTKPELMSQITLQIDNPKIEFSELAFYKQGRKIESSDLGLKFDLQQKIAEGAEDPATSVQATLGTSQTIYPNVKISLLNFMTKGLDLLYVPQIQIRVGKEWRSTDRLGRGFVVENRDLIRKELTEHELGQEIAQWIEREALKEISPKLGALSFGFNSEFQNGFHKWKFPVTGYFHAKGQVITPNLRLKDIGVDFKDRGEREQACKGIYLVSAEVRLQAPEMLPLEMHDLKLHVKTENAGPNLEGDILVNQVHLQLRQRKESDQEVVPDTEFVMTVDLCEGLDGVEPDIQLAGFRHNMNTLVPTIDVNGVGSSETTFELLANLFGIPEMGAPRDKFVKNLLEGVWAENQSAFSLQISSALLKFFQENVPEHLRSDAVRGQMKVALVKRDQYENELTSFMYNIGEHIKGPLEKKIVEELQEFFKEAEPKADSFVQQYFALVHSSLLEIGKIVGDHFEAVAYSQMISMVNGKSSSEAMSVEIARRLRPSLIAPKLVETFAIGGATMTSEEKVQEVLQPVEISQLIDSCPSDQPNKTLAKFESGLQELGGGLRPDQILDYVKLVRERCGGVKDANAVSWFDKGVKSLNEWLTDVSVKKYYALKENEHMPLIAQKVGAERAFESELQVKELGVVELEDTTLLRASLINSKILNEGESLRTGVSSKEFAEMMNDSKQSIALRVPVLTMNQLLLKIDWERLIRIQMPGLPGNARIDIPIVPYITPDGDLVFEASIKLINPIVKILAKFWNMQDSMLDHLFKRKNQYGKADQVVNVVVSLADFQSWFEPVAGEVRMSQRLVVDLRSDGNKLKGRLELTSEDIEHLEATDGLDKPLEKVIRQARHTVNKAFQEFLDEFALPSLKGFSNVFQFQRLRMIDGDVYLIFKRQDGANIPNSSAPPDGDSWDVPS